MGLVSALLGSVVEARDGFVLVIELQYLAAFGIFP
ncbi:hypothetical protein MED193_06024 [Roseobacter sp. MED193]|nr:hypothetical protein MED193_06024 [Roseobacter sp. MED193]